MTCCRESLRLLLSFLKYFADRNIFKFYAESKSRHEGWQLNLETIMVSLNCLIVRVSLHRYPFNNPSYRFIG